MYIPSLKQFYFLLIFCFSLPVSLRGQEVIQMSVHPGESFYVHPEASVSIYSDINISGSFGSYLSSTVNFLGERWNNRSGSRITDESLTGAGGTGGVIKFSGTASSQYINNQNTIQSNKGFPNIKISNSRNVILEGTDLVVRKSLNFESGRVILNNRNAVMQLNSLITGFNASRYFVTGTGTNGGALIRKSTGLQQPAIIFPVGTTVNSYTPSSVDYTGIPQDLKVRVFDNVYDKAYFGTPDNVNFVTKTWNIALSNLDPKASLILNMQHNAAEEGAQFAANKNQSFVSRYITNLEKWDITASSGFSPGIITSGNAIANSYISSRIITGDLTQNEFFSKTVKSDNVLSNYRVPSGISPNNDGLNDKFVIENLKPADKVRIEIYNRWQSIVFRDSNYKNTFEGIGNQNGLLSDTLPDGTYYYILNFNDSKPITGYIIINR